MTRPNPRHLLLNLLTAADDQSLSARDAIAACALFGITENSVRVTLVRLAAAGLIEAAGRGSYRLGPNATGLAADVAGWRQAEQRLRDWNGDWVAVHVGNLGRSDRTALRVRDRALALLGLCELERGLYLRPDNLLGGVGAVRDRLYKLGLDSDAAVFRLADLDPARDARARGLWDGEALNRRYRDITQRLDAWLAKADALEPEAAARESYLLGNDAIRHMVFDPLLPEPLVDTAARRACADLVQHFDRAGHDIWRQLYDSFRPAAVNTGDSAVH
jgi:phenylacetic acid degradation operon negative regulatory protein